MTIIVTANEQACGAQVSGVNLANELDTATISQLRGAWLEHKVLAFPDQKLTDTDLERLALYFGKFGDEPYFVPIDGSEHVVALCRRAAETAPIFAEAWHTDWSFQPSPPIGTCLYSLTIPPVGGDTSFINQQKALAEMPTALRQKVEGLKGLHSAAAGYAPDGLYGEADKESDRSMKILYSESAREIQPHPLIIRHPETGQDALYGCFGYIAGIENMAQDEAAELLLELYEWQTREEFQYHHRWQENMFVIWDNRSVLHKANGGYDGYDRELHRITVALDSSKYLN